MRALLDIGTSVVGMLASHIPTYSESYRTPVDITVSFVYKKLFAWQ